MSRFYTPSAAADGPDWVDVGVMVRELQNLSGGSVEFVLTCPADKYSGPVYVAARHTYPVLIAGARPSIDEVRGEYPNKQQKSMSALVFKLAMQLDMLYAPYGEQLPMDL